MGFPTARKTIGPPPLAHRFKIGPLRLVPAMDRRAAQRLKQIAPRLTGQRPERHRAVRRAEGGGAHLWDRLVQTISKHRQTVDVTQLSLIGCHAQSGIALGMFNRTVAFTRGQLHV